MRLSSHLMHGADAGSLALITIQYPEQGSVFPPDIAPPLFQWRDDTPEARLWRIQVQFAAKGPKVQAWSDGPKMEIGEIDTTLTGYVPPELTPEQKAAHT